MDTVDLLIQECDKFIDLGNSYINNSEKFKEKVESKEREIARRAKLFILTLVLIISGATIFFGFRLFSVISEQLKEYNLSSSEVERK